MDGHANKKAKNRSDERKQTIFSKDKADYFL